MSCDLLVSIVISTYGKDAAVLRKTLDSIVDSDMQRGEIVIVDQNKDSRVHDLVGRYIHEHPGVRMLYVKSDRIGLSHARNLGIAESKGNWILFLDDDAILPHHAFGRIQSLLEEDEPVVFYGNVLNIGTMTAYIKRAIRTTRLFLFNFDTPCSIGLLFNRKVVEETGGFDVNFGLGSCFGAGEESDLVIRILKKGFAIKYLKDFTVLHPPPSFGAARKQLYGYGLGAVYRKHIRSCWTCLFALGIRFFLEIVMRVVLGLFYFFAGFQKSKAHFQYLAGFIKGFLFYGERSVSQAETP